MVEFNNRIRCIQYLSYVPLISKNLNNLKEE